MRTRGLALVAFAIAGAAALSIAADAPERHFPPPQPLSYTTGGVSVPALRYVPDPEPGRVKNILYSGWPPGYIADSAAFFGRNGVDGFIMNAFMGGFGGDVWQQPHRFTPNNPQGRVVGAANPLFQLAKRMNDNCHAAGIHHNSLNAYFSGRLPDWFDDAGWRQVVENFRQAAVFARDAGFIGLSIDMEYVHEQYAWKYPAYMENTYPRHLLAEQARKRGDEILAAMLAEFPNMEFWILPEVPSTNEWLANDMFVGYLEALSERDAPGGLHIFKEGTYLQTRPRTMLTSVDVSNQRNAYVLRRASERARDYWRRKGTIAAGMWPLGYYNEMRDETGQTVRYGGKYETFGDADVGSQADKTDNYSVPEWRRAYAAARMMSERYVWQYCHGQVYTQMTPEQMERYHGSANDTLPTIRNVDEYLAVLRNREILVDPLWAEAAKAMREERPLPHYDGYPATWWILGPVPYTPEFFNSMPLPRPAGAQGVDVTKGWRFVDGQYPYPWQELACDSTGKLDLKKILGKTGTPIAWGVQWVESDRARRVWIGVGTNDNGAVYVNGNRVYSYIGMRAAMVDDDRIAVDIPRGRSEILVACGDFGGATWNFTLRVTDEQGNVIPGVRWVGPPQTRATTSR